MILIHNFFMHYLDISLGTLAIVVFINCIEYLSKINLIHQLCFYLFYLSFKLNLVEQAKTGLSPKLLCDSCCFMDWRALVKFKDAVKLFLADFASNRITVSLEEDKEGRKRKGNMITLAIVLEFRRNDLLVG